MRKLTDRQMKILGCINRWVDERGYPPSVREIAQETGTKSTRGVTINLDVLEQEGYLHRDATARSISLIPQGPVMRTRMIPLIGTIAAGTPIRAFENTEALIPVPETFTPEGEGAMVLRVRGDSMQDEGIHDGDLVVVREQPVVDNGELAAVMIEGEATVKRFYRDSDDQIRLEPANPAYEPIIVSLKVSRTMVVGKVVGLLRNYR